MSEWLKESRRYTENQEDEGQQLNRRKSEHLRDRLRQVEKSPHQRSNANLPTRRRMIPKNISHDKQQLYEQNIRLSQNIQSYKDEVMKLKARLNRSQKQKDKLVTECNEHEQPGNNFSLPVFKLNRKHFQLQYKYKELRESKVEKDILNENQYRKIIRQNRIEIEELKKENAKLKKTVKYTEICELNIQNQHLAGECKRISGILQSKILDFNKNTDYYEGIIGSLRAQLEEERRKNNRMQFELRKKNKEIESLSKKVKQNKTKERKIHRQLQMFRKDEKIERYSTDYSDRLKNKLSITTHFKCGETNCENYENLAKEVQRLKEAWQKMENKNHAQNTRKQKQENSQQKEQEEAKQQKPIQISFHPTSQNVSPPKEQEKIQQNEDLKVSIKFNQQQVGESSPELDKIEAVTIKKQQENDEQINNTSQFKVQRPYDQVLKETIKYRLICLRYAYHELIQDVRESQMEAFTVSQIGLLLSDEPFYLDKDQLEYVLLYIFEQSEENMKDKVTAQNFLAKMKNFMEDFQGIQQDKYIEILSKCQRIIKRNITKLTPRFEQFANSQSRLSKKKFVKILQQFYFSPEQIQILLGQACIVSQDIQNIKYKEFLKRICPPNKRGYKQSR